MVPRSYLGPVEDTDSDVGRRQSVAKSTPNIRARRPAFNEYLFLRNVLSPMIRIEDLTNDDVGREVTYRPWSTAPDSMLEYGVITSWRAASNTIFVRYGSNQTAAATSADDLTWST